MHADFSTSEVKILDGHGADVTDRMQGGKIGALLEIRNQVVPGYQADLDRLAAGLADTVNTVLAAGVDMNGQPPAQNLFTYDAASGAARTIGVSSLTPAELGLATMAAPGGNGNALALAGLDQTPGIDGFTLSTFYGNLAARAGRALQTAREESTTTDELVTQARSWRDEVSKVSLDEEAVMLIQYQRAFQASAKMVTTLNEMTQELMGLIS